MRSAGQTRLITAISLLGVVSLGCASSTPLTRESKTLWILRAEVRPTVPIDGPSLWISAEAPHPVGLKVEPYAQAMAADARAAAPQLHIYVPAEMAVPRGIHVDAGPVLESAHDAEMPLDRAPGPLGDASGVRR